MASLWISINVLNTSSLRLLEIKKGSCEEKLGQIYLNICDLDIFYSSP